MLKKNHHFYREIRGQIIHVTSIKGLQGILRDGRILPNLDGSMGYAYWGRQAISYCQKQGAISVLDLQSADEDKLFDTSGPARHWTGVFSFHHPTLLLFINSSFVTPFLNKPSCCQYLSEKDLYIAEVEACCKTEIPTSWITGGLLIGKRYRVILRSSHLDVLLERAVQVKTYTRRTRKRHILTS